MTDADAALLALRHYRTLWLGQPWADVLPLWQTEYTAVSTGAFAPILFTASSFDGESSTAQKQFEQTARVAALQAYRSDLDPEYAAAVFATPPAAAQPPSVMYPVFSFCFPH